MLKGSPKISMRLKLDFQIEKIGFNRKLIGFIKANMRSIVEIIREMQSNQGLEDHDNFF